MPTKDQLEALDKEFDEMFDKIESTETEEDSQEEREVLDDNVEDNDLEDGSKEEKGKNEDQSDFVLNEEKTKEAHAFEQMRKEKAAFKKQLEEQERLLKEFEAMSRAAGFKTPEELLQEWKLSEQAKEAENKGVPKEVLKQLQEQQARLESLEKEKQEIERQAKQKTVVGQIDRVVADLELTEVEANTLIDSMGKDGVTWEQLMVLPEAAIASAVRGYAAPILLEKQKQASLKKDKERSEFEEPRIKGKRKSPKQDNPFSDESLAKEMEAYRKEHYPYLK